MTGLRVWTRDASIPARGGDPELSPPDEEQVRDWIEGHLLAPRAPRVQDLSWDYARWKPGVSMTCGYRVRFEGGDEETVLLKRYRDDKARSLAERPDPNVSNARKLPWLESRAILPEAALVLWTPTGDRELGLRYLLDPKRVAKLLRDAGLVDAGLLRRRKTRFERVRYKPERRAVYRVHLSLRDAEGTKLELGVRVLPPEHAARIIERRLAFEHAGGRGLGPTLLTGHARHGLLVEPWLDVQTHAPTDFDHAGRAGERLAQLHGLRAGQEKPRPRREGNLEPLFAGDPSLLERYRALPSSAPAPRHSWVHGDFHPDQVAISREGTVLLDLDCLALGDPTEDLVSWIADHLYEQPGSSWEEASADLLSGYVSAGGEAPSTVRLVQAVAMELARRAAASIRRLEEGAYGRARTTLDRAGELLA